MGKGERGRVQSGMGGGCAEVGHSIAPCSRDACRKEGTKEGEASAVVSNLMYGLVATQGKGVAFCTVGCDK